jgi:hypothetical protein
MLHNRVTMHGAKENIKSFLCSLSIMVQLMHTTVYTYNKTRIQMSHIKTLKKRSDMFRSSADHHQGAF